MEVLGYRDVDPGGEGDPPAALNKILGREPLFAHPPKSDAKMQQNVDLHEKFLLKISRVPDIPPHTGRAH